MPFIDHNASPFSEERATRVSLLTHFSRELVRSLGEPPLAPIDHIIVSPSLSSPPAIFFAQLRNTRHPPVESHFSTRNPCLEPPPVFLRFAVSSRGAPGRPHLRHSHPHRPTHTDSTPIALSRDRHSGCFETARALQTNGGCFSQPYTLWRRYGVPRRRTPPARVRPGDQLLLRGERHTQSTTTGIDTILPMRLLSGTEYGAPRQQPVGVRPRLHHHVRPVPTCEGGNRRRAGFRDRRGDSPRRGLPGPSCGTLLLHAAPASRRRRNSVLESRVQRYSLHRAAAAPKDGRLPPARGGEREWSCLSLHRFASTAFPLFAAGVDEPLPASLSVALHLQPQPTFARDSHRSSGEDPGQCRAAPRPPAKGTPRPRPPNRIPSYPCVHHFTPRTRSIATFRSSLTVFRSSPISSSECTGVVDGPHPDRRPRQCPVHPFLTAYAVSQPVEITPHHFHPGGESAPATAFETTAPTLRQSPLLAAKLARTPRVSSHSPGDRTRNRRSSFHGCFSRIWRSTIGAKPRLNAVRVDRGPRTTHSPWSRPITRPA